MFEKREKRFDVKEEEAYSGTEVEASESSLIERQAFIIL